MSGNRLQSIRQLLAAGSTLNESVRARLELIERFQLAVDQALPEDLKRHCRVANVRQDTLILTAKDPLWAAKARHHSVRILHATAVIGKIRRIQVIVDPEITPVARYRQAELSKVTKDDPT